MRARALKVAPKHRHPFREHLEHVTPLPPHLPAYPTHISASSKPPAAAGHVAIPPRGEAPYPQAADHSRAPAFPFQKLK